MQYRDRINDGRLVFLNGNLVKNISQEKAFKGAVDYVQKYYDLQNTEPELFNFKDESGRDGHISLLIPRNKEDLQRKREAYKAISDLSYGMLGRTPDFMNAAISTIAAHSSFLGQGLYCDYSENAENYYDFIKRENLFVGHGAINPQIDRSKTLGEQKNKYSAVHVTNYNSQGIIVSGSKMIVTLAPIADELLIFNMPGLKSGDEDYALAFALPVNQTGVKIVCRKPLVKEGFSKFDYPISNEFDEIDAYLLLENVFIPWNRVFVFKDVLKSNQFYDKTFARHHTGHQGIVRGLSKAEFLTGIAIKLANVLKLDGFINVQEKLGALTSYIELLKASILLSEEEATFSNEGVITPSINAIQAIRYNFPKMYEEMVKQIQSLAAGSMLSTPHSNDFNNENEEALMIALSSESINAKDRTKLLNLAWDVSGDGFGQRQLVYEYYHAGDPMRIAAGHYLNYPKNQMIEMINKVLNNENDQVRMFNK